MGENIGCSSVSPNKPKSAQSPLTKQAKSAFTRSTFDWFQLLSFRAIFLFDLIWGRLQIFKKWAGQSRGWFVLHNLQMRGFFFTTYPRQLALIFLLPPTLGDVFPGPFFPPAFNFTPIIWMKSISEHFLLQTVMICRKKLRDYLGICPKQSECVCALKVTHLIWDPSLWWLSELTICGCTPIIGLPRAKYSNHRAHSGEKSGVFQLKYFICHLMPKPQKQIVHNWKS